MENLYTEPLEAGNAYRQTYLEQVQGVVASLRAESHAKRRALFAADYASEQAYAASVVPLREKFRAMLGYPLVGTPNVPPVPTVRQSFVAQDELGEIHRMQIEAMPGYEMYGLLFLPPTRGPHRLVISQHGGGGAPETTAGFFGSANYNDMTRRLQRRGFAVFAPQLLLWHNEYGEGLGEGPGRRQIDVQLKQVGSSITALELFGLQRSLDYLLDRDDILPDGAGICGLSYGGFYTLFAAANDPRLRAAVSSCFVNDRFRYDWTDWTWPNAGNLFLDAEVAALVCPRPLHIELGETDELFDAASAGPVLDEIRAHYRQLGLERRFEGRVFPGGHEFATTDLSLDFLEKHLGWV